MKFYKPCVVLWALLMMAGCIHDGNKAYNALYENQTLMDRVYTELSDVVAEHCRPDTPLYITSTDDDPAPMETILREKGYATSLTECEGCLALSFDIDLYEDNDSPGEFILTKIILDGVFYTRGFSWENGALISRSLTSKGDLSPIP